MTFTIFYCDFQFILYNIHWTFSQLELSFLPGAVNETLLFIDSCKGALFTQHCGSYQSLPSTPSIPSPSPCSEYCRVKLLFNLTFPAPTFPSRFRILKPRDLSNAWTSVVVQNAEGLQGAKTLAMSLAKNVAQWYIRDITFQRYYY